MASMETHVEKVLKTTESASAAALSRLAAAWSRSFKKHGLNPAERRETGRIFINDLKHRMDKMGEILHVAGPRLDEVFSLVGKPGCGVLLTDAKGVIVDKRCKASDENDFGKWGIWQGADWSEEAEGTNGVGTCLVEERKTIIHRDEHFYARNIGISCMGVPVYGPAGNIAGALDISSARDDQTTNYNSLLIAILTQAANRIEADTFKMAYSEARIMMTNSDNEDGNALVAIDQNDLVVGATRAARKQFKLEFGNHFQPFPSIDLYKQNIEQNSFQTAERKALIQELVRVNKNVSKAARRLGIGRATMYRRMSKLGVSLEAI